MVQLDHQLILQEARAQVGQPLKVQEDQHLSALEEQADQILLALEVQADLPHSVQELEALPLSPLQVVLMEALLGPQVYHLNKLLNNKQLLSKHSLRLKQALSLSSTSNKMLQHSSQSLLLSNNRCLEEVDILLQAQLVMQEELVVGILHMELEVQQADPTAIMVVVV